MTAHRAGCVFTALAAAFFLSWSLVADGAQAKPVKQEFQDLKIAYTGAAASSIDLVLQDANGKPLSKFKVQVKADGFSVAGFSDHFTLTGAVAANSTVTIRIKSVGAYTGKIGLQSAIFLDAAGKPTGQGAASGGALSGDPIYDITNDVAFSPDLRLKTSYSTSSRLRSTSLPSTRPSPSARAESPSRTSHWTETARWPPTRCRPLQTFPSSSPRARFSSRASQGRWAGSSTATRLCLSRRLGQCRRSASPASVSPAIVCARAVARRKS